MNDPYGQQQDGSEPQSQSGAGYPSNMPPQSQQSPSPQPGQAPYPGAAPYYGTQQQNNTLAIVSLVCSIAGIVICTPAAIAGVITGHMARRRIRENPATYTGDGMALAGVIIGWIMTVVLILGVIAGIVIVAVGASQGAH